MAYFEVDKPLQPGISVNLLQLGRSSPWTTPTKKWCMFLRRRWLATVQAAQMRSGRWSSDSFPMIFKKLLEIAWWANFTTISEYRKRGEMKDAPWWLWKSKFSLWFPNLPMFSTLTGSTVLRRNAFWPLGSISPTKMSFLICYKVSIRGPCQFGFFSLWENEVTHMFNSSFSSRPAVWSNSFGKKWLMISLITHFQNHLQGK